MNRIHRHIHREHGISNDQRYDYVLPRLCVAKEDSWRGICPSTYSADFNPEPPIFSAKFANCDGSRHILAIANEDGKIALQDTTKRNDEPEERALPGQQCHFNAVFDLEWAPQQMKFVSASGDHTACLWDVGDGGLVKARTFIGHSRSVKTAAFRRNDSAVFATGGRDGAISIWDTRATVAQDLTPRADNCIYSGHVGGPGTPVSQRRRTRTPKIPSNTTLSSITGLAFQDPYTLISCGAGDGVIKVWDLRRNYTTYKKEPLPKHSLPYAGSSTFKGFTNLIVDAAGSRLYANCMDNTIYAYNLHSYAATPLARYKGLLNSTFYIKACLSPDGRYLLSGSSDDRAFIWSLDHPAEPLVALTGHAVEVTCVAWGATHDCPIVTCSDDARHKIWRIGPEQLSDVDRRDLYRGGAAYVRQFGKVGGGSGATHKYNLRELESTPRSLRRLVEQNERTPNSVEKVAAKRSFLEMLGEGAAAEDHEPKRPKTATEATRGRRLFGPSTSAGAVVSPPVRCLNVQLSAIVEERCSPTTATPTTATPTADDSNQENAARQTPPSVAMNGKPSDSPPVLSPLGERLHSQNRNYTSPPASASSSAPSSVIFSPTSNLPNYVLDGEAPHLGIMSPKRKHKSKIDWLTKIRKQKLMSSCRGASLLDKMADASETAAGVLSSPRLHSLRHGEGGSPRGVTSPRRRTSHSGNMDSHSPQQAPRTPTSSRRNSETTILRFFSVQSGRGAGGNALHSSDEAPLSPRTHPAAVALSPLSMCRTPTTAGD